MRAPLCFTKKALHFSHLALNYQIITLSFSLSLSKALLSLLEEYFLYIYQMPNISHLCQSPQEKCLQVSLLAPGSICALPATTVGVLIPAQMVDDPAPKSIGRFGTNSGTHSHGKGSQEGAPQSKTSIARLTGVLPEPPACDSTPCIWR